VFQISFESACEFSRRPIHNKNISDKKKQRGGFAFFLTFLAKQKSD
jgi:hypothetical protein